MKNEYHDGHEATERLEKMVTTVFRAPESIVKPTPKIVRKPKKTSKG